MDPRHDVSGDPVFRMRFGRATCRVCRDGLCLVGVGHGCGLVHAHLCPRCVGSSIQVPEGKPQGETLDLRSQLAVVALRTLVVFHRAILETEDSSEQWPVHAHIKFEQVGPAALVVVNI